AEAALAAQRVVGVEMRGAGAVDGLRAPLRDGIEQTHAALMRNARGDGGAVQRRLYGVSRAGRRVAAAAERGIRAAAWRDCGEPGPSTAAGPAGREWQGARPRVLHRR